MDLILKQIFGGEDVTVRKAAPKTEVNDGVSELVRAVTLQRSTTGGTTCAEKAANEWNQPLSTGGTLEKRATQDRRALACGQRNIGVRIERSPNGWTREFDAAGNLLCGYLEE